MLHTFHTLHPQLGVEFPLQVRDLLAALSFIYNLRVETQPAGRIFWTAPVSRLVKPFSELHSIVLMPTVQLSDRWLS